MSFAKIRISLGVIGVLISLFVFVFACVETWNDEEASWITDGATLRIALLIGSLSLVIGSFCIFSHYDSSSND